MSANDNCLWDAATDDQRREFTRQMINFAKMFHEHDAKRLQHMRTLRSGLEVLQVDIAAAGRAINPSAKDIAAELLRSADEFLSFEHPKIDWQEQLACVGGDNAER